LDEHYPDELWAIEIVADGRVLVTNPFDSPTKVGDFKLE